MTKAGRRAFLKQTALVTASALVSVDINHLSEYYFVAHHTVHRRKNPRHRPGFLVDF